MNGALPTPGFSVREVELILGIAGKMGHKLINTGKLKSFAGVDGSRRVSDIELYCYIRDKENITNK